MKVAVSFIKSKYTIKETIDKINETSCDFIHVDIMDGMFVENRSYDFEDIELVLKDNHKPIDIHLMCVDPYKHMIDYVKLKPYNITFHIEAVPKPEQLISYLHENGVRCGIAINPETSIEKIKPYLDLIDTVLVMTVNPGKGGQPFMVDVAEKVNELSRLKSNVIIEVDGGVNNESMKYLSNADMVVSGSYVCESNNFEERVQLLK